MESTEIVDLYTNIDAALEQGEPARALRLIAANFDALSDPALLRERAAKSLIELGRTGAAVDIYERVAQHYLNSGHPARLIATVKKIERLDETPEALLDRFVALYNVRSPFLDTTRRHAAFGTPDAELVTEISDVDFDPDDLEETVRTDALESGPFVDEPPEDLPPVPVLSQLPSEVLRQIIDAIELGIRDDLEQISGPDVSEGQLLWTVSADCTIGDDDPTYRIRPGTLLGLHRHAPTPLAGERRVFARSGTELLGLSPEAVRSLRDEFAAFDRALSTVARRSFVEGLLENHPMFDVLPNDQRENLLSRFVGLSVDEGTPLLEEGEESPGLFLIVDGEIDIVRSDEDWEITIRTLGPGDVIGEMGLVSDHPARASATVTEGGHLLHMPADVFDSVASDYPELAKWAVGLAQERREELESTLSAQDLAEISE